MSLDDTMSSPANAAVIELGARITADLRTFVDQLVLTASAERDEAVAAARTQVAQELGAIHTLALAELDATAKVALEQALTEAREQERRVAGDMLLEMKTSADRQVAAATATADARVAEAVSTRDAEIARVTREASATMAEQREAGRAAAGRLIESVRGLDGASSLSEVLDALGRAAARESARAAVLVLRNERLLGWRLAGFGPSDAQPKAIDLGLSECGIAGIAVTASRAITTDDEMAPADGLGFAPMAPDSIGMVVPVVVGGRVVAVVYADTSKTAEPTGWQETIELLARHAARCLEALTVQKVNVSTAPRFWVAPGSPGARNAAPTGMTA